MKIRNISSASSPIVPVKVYENADIQQDQILAENKGKAGIYKCGRMGFAASQP
jgi:hypothetical protein